MSQILRYEAGSIVPNVLMTDRQQGFHEMDEVRGDGSAELDDDGSLEIEIRFHLGDEATLTAQQW